MSIPIGIFALLHFGQMGLSAYAGTHSLRAIAILQDYEEPSERAAKYSKTAAHQLSKTRKTQTAGAMAIMLSLLSASGLVLLPLLPHNDFMFTRAKAIFYALNIAIPFGARVYMADFWDEKVKVPLMESYNEAISQTRLVWTYLQRITWSWLAVGALEVVFYLCGAVTD